MGFHFATKPDAKEKTVREKGILKRDGTEGQAKDDGSSLFSPEEELGHET
jgi:hypothetical protein